MRRFVDFVVYPKTEEEYKKMVSFCKELDFEILSVGIKGDIKNIDWIIKNDILWFYLLNADSVKEFKRHYNAIKKLFRKKRGGLFLESKNYSLLREVVEKRMVDALYNLPLSFDVFKIDQVLIRRCAENNVALIFDFNSVNKLTRWEKVKYFRNMYKILKLSYKYNVMTIITSGAENVFNMRKPRDLASFSFIIYRNLKLALDSVSDTPLKFIDFIRKLNDPKRVLPGVYILDGDEKDA